ncbi:30S ribosomal protein S5 [Nanobdella aerobiophila]|uniref:Small ribosomal subunit protein uS5 n=1 Tax=Nanobdella aerobiophila TaxID=2586965 RepID=A0A915WRN3_9ARCH|nr:30S ribosomal protein S5 [Nanobdella aerobiophila]BBL45888.1 30S ribosomal protein S5 [Nanobdella aerobiophila]
MVDNDILEKAEEKENETLKKIDNTNNDLDSWNPKTKLGKLVKEGKITSIEQVFSQGYKILEPEVVDILLPNLKYNYIKLSLSRGKYRRPKLVKMVQRKTAEGNKTSWVSIAAVGNENGYIGVGVGKSWDVQLSMEKALRIAKLNIIPIARGCGSWECSCRTPHSLPYRVDGSSGSVRVTLLPAPKGIGLVASEEMKKILKLAGIRDLWMKSFGQTRKRINFAVATYNALKKTLDYRIRPEYKEISGIKIGFA